MQILYLVHDIADAAVSRRIAMLQDGGATVSLTGFRRTEKVPETINSATVTDLGRTYNAGFKQRIIAVFKVLLKLRSYKSLFSNKEVLDRTQS